jgi:hypothetical protein
MRCQLSGWIGSTSNHQERTGDFAKKFLVRIAMPPFRSCKPGRFQFACSTEAKARQTFTAVQLAFNNSDRISFGQVGSCGPDCFSPT